MWKMLKRNKLGLRATAPFACLFVFSLCMLWRSPLLGTMMVGGDGGSAMETSARAQPAGRQLLAGGGKSIFEYVDFVDPVTMGWVVSVLICLTILLEICIEFLEHFMATHHSYEKMVWKIFTEIMLLGILSFCLFINEHGLPQSIVPYDELMHFEIAHFAFFMFGIMYSINCMLLVWSNTGIRKDWDDLDSLTWTELEDWLDPDKHFEEKLEAETGGHHTGQDVGEKHGMRCLKFRVFHLWFILKHHVNMDIDFARYLKMHMINSLTHIVHIGIGMWVGIACSVWFVAGVFVAIQKGKGSLSKLEVAWYYGIFGWLLFGIQAADFFLVKNKKNRLNSCILGDTEEETKERFKLCMKIWHAAKDKCSGKAEKLLGPDNSLRMSKVFEDAEEDAVKQHITAHEKMRSSATEEMEAAAEKFEAEMPEGWNQSNIDAHLNEWRAAPDAQRAVFETIFVLQNLYFAVGLTAMVKLVGENAGSGWAVLYFVYLFAPVVGIQVLVTGLLKHLTFTAGVLHEDKDASGEVLHNQKEGRILLRETAMFLSRNNHLDHDFIIGTFEAMDTDGDKTLTYDEFREGLKNFGLRLNSTQFYNVCRVIDKDHDRTIETEEFIRALYRSVGEEGLAAHAEHTSIRVGLLVTHHNPDAEDLPVQDLQPEAEKAGQVLFPRVCAPSRTCGFDSGETSPRPATSMPLQSTDSTESFKAMDVHL